MIVLKSSDDGNGITPGAAKVDNVVAVVAPIAEDNSDISFLSNVSIFRTDANNDKNGAPTENHVKEGL